VKGGSLKGTTRTVETYGAVYEAYVNGTNLKIISSHQRNYKLTQQNAIT
jgi:hypothetical protein